MKLSQKKTERHRRLFYPKCRKSVKMNFQLTQNTTLSHPRRKVRVISLLSKMSNVFKTLGRAVRFSDYLFKYRQLQIATTILNQIAFFLFPVFMIIGLELGCVVGYVIINLYDKIPLPLIFLWGNKLNSDSWNMH